MTDMVPMYGFGGGGGTGATLTITAPVGATVTVSKDGKVNPSKVATTGTVVFKGLETGTWTITISNGTDTATKTVEIKADYQDEISFFSATINITYPAGSTCTATNGDTTLTAPDTSGTWACTVNKAGTWTVGYTSGAIRQARAITPQNGATVDVTLRNWLFDYGATANNYSWVASADKADNAPNQAPLAPEVTKNSDGSVTLSRNAPTGDKRGGYKLVNIDLTNVDTIHADIIGTYDYDLETGLFILPNTFSYYYGQAVAKKPMRAKADNFASGTHLDIAVDVSKLTGYYTVYIPCFAQSGRTSSVTIREVWCE